MLSAINVHKSLEHWCLLCVARLYRRPPPPSAACAALEKASPETAHFKSFQFCCNFQYAMRARQFNVFLYKVFASFGKYSRFEDRNVDSRQIMLGSLLYCTLCIVSERQMYFCCCWARSMDKAVDVSGWFIAMYLYILNLVNEAATMDFVIWISC